MASNDGSGMATDADPYIIPDVPVVATTDRISPNQVAAGVTRATQTIAGTDGSFITEGLINGTTQLGIAQYDKNAKKVSQYGQQADGSTGLKFFDDSGLGLAQFIRAQDGTTSIKFAKPGVDVSTATPDQLIFNSAQNILKIVKKIPVTIPGFSLTYNSSNGTTTGGILLPVAHNLGYAPLAQIYVQGYLFNYNPFQQIASSYIPLPVTPLAMLSGGYVFMSVSDTLYKLNISYAVDVNNVYIQAIYYFQGDSTDVMSPIQATIFLFQETATVT